MLALTADELAGTDTADHALKALRLSEVQEIVVLGRRGPAQAAYTNPELLELEDLADADVVVASADVEADEHSRAYLESDEADATARKNVEIVSDDRVEGVRIVRNELVRSDDGRLSAQPTDATEVIEAGLVFRSIGYRGTAIGGVPFDERRATIRNDAGRVTDPASGEPLLGVYTAGWIKRGPSGVIGTNKRCATETVELLLEDLAAGRLPEPARDRDALVGGVTERGVELVDYPGWQAIDEHERGLGESSGRARVKLVRRHALLDRARSASGTRA